MDWKEDPENATQIVATSLPISNTEYCAMIARLTFFELPSPQDSMVPLG